jgi:hypothetical protein
MRRILLSIFLLISICSFGQAVNNDRNIAIADTVSFRDSFPPVPDSVKIISADLMRKAFIEISDQLKKVEDKMTAKEQRIYYEAMNAFGQSIINIAVADYNSKRKPIKVPVKK